MANFKSTYTGDVVDNVVSSVISGKAGLQGIIVNGTEVTPDQTTNKVSVTVPSATRYTATLSTSWSGDSAPYTQTVNVTGILSTDVPVVDVVLDESTETAISQLEGWSCVSKIETSDGSITATCLEEIPTVSLPIQMSVVR